MPDVQSYSAQKVTTAAPFGALFAPSHRELSRFEETNVKLFLAISALAGSVSLLMSDWAGNAFPYL